MGRLWIGIALLAGLFAVRPAESEPVVHARIEQALDVYTVNRDLTFTRIVTEDTTLLTERALRRRDRAEETFYPDKQALEVVEAWVDQPGGERIKVADGSIFTRPSAASESAPGFVNSLTTTVLFPQLRIGSRIHVVWRFVQKTPALLGFNVYNMNAFEWDTRSDETRIDIPADIPLHWRARGGFIVEETVAKGMRHIVARLRDTAGREREAAMVAPSDFMPQFLATTLPAMDEIGTILYRNSDGRAKPTPEIAALAARIAGDSVGIDAARLIHDWVARNIRYIAVYMNPDDGYIPHEAAEVLKAGYGDCKDYVVLMQALLAARGIEGRMAIVDWGTRYAEPLLWSPYNFNHAILWLPAYDHYLNPTDRSAGFEALDRHLSGKPVVIVDAKGRSARTPEATAAANRYIYTARVVLGEDGAMDGAAQFTMAPNAEIQIRQWLAAASSMTEMAERLLNRTAEGGFGRFETSDPRDLLRPLALSATWHSKMAANRQGHHMIVRAPTGLDLFPPYRERAKLSPSGHRQTPLLAEVGDTRWETTIVLPRGMTVATLPEDVTLETKVGRYLARYTHEDRTIRVERSLTIAQQIVAPESYPELERLLYGPLVDARSVIVLTQGAEVD
jgi:transglutaminase-like putative cysteine protease